MGIKTKIVTGIAATFAVASVGMTSYNPEKPKGIGEFVFAKLQFRDQSTAGLTDYGNYLYNRYQTDQAHVLQDRYRYYYRFDFEKASREERYAALLRGPQRGISSFVQEALLARATVNDCTQAAYSQSTLEQCVQKLEKSGVISNKKLLDYRYGS